MFEGNRRVEKEKFLLMKFRIDQNVDRRIYNALLS
jgi:hypothetical protein